MTALRWAPAPDAVTLRRKPAIGQVSAGGWFETSVGGKRVWATVSLIDLTGEPHVRGWALRKNPHIVGNPVTADNLVPTGEGVSVDFLASYSPERSSDEVACYALRALDQVVFASQAFLRYFASKHPGCQFRYHAAENALTVHSRQACVGVLAPVRRDPMSVDGVLAAIAYADSLRNRQEAA